MTKHNYVSYKAEDDSTSTLMVYIADNNQKNSYYGFEIGFEKDTSDLIFSNQYRLKGCEIYKLVGSQMVSTGLTALTKGENEFVYKTPNKVDFTGGYHGDEQLIEVNFLIDNEEIELRNNFELMPCKEFVYIQKSSMHESSSKVDGINYNHPVEAIHIKKTCFNNNGYTTSNTIKWQKDLELQTVFGSLVCIDRDFGGYGKSQSMDTIKFNLDGKKKLRSNDKSITLWNTRNKTKVNISSDFSINNDLSYQWIWDHKVYNKYYRDIGKVKAKKGDEWLFITKVKFELNENTIYNNSYR
jgi:hypothetical protein